MNVEIKNRFNGNTIITGEYSSIKEALEKNSAVDFTGARLSGIDLIAADLAGINLTRADMPGTDLIWANLTRINLTMAHLFRTNLTRANLTWANLTDANLTGLDLTDADLTDADLTGANLFGVNLCKTIGLKTPIISISGSIHNFCYYNGKITIGCECHSVDYWIKRYKKIGKINGYSHEQIDEYFGYIKMCEKYL